MLASEISRVEWKIGNGDGKTVPVVLIRRRSISSIRTNMICEIPQAYSRLFKNHLFRLSGRQLAHRNLAARLALKPAFQVTGSR